MRKFDISSSQASLSCVHPAKVSISLNLWHFMKLNSLFIPMHENDEIHPKHKHMNFFYIFLIATQTFSRYEVSFCSNSSSNEGAKWELNYTYMWKMRLCEKTLLIITPRAIHKHKKMFFFSFNCSWLCCLRIASEMWFLRYDEEKKIETLACIHVNNFSRDRQSTAKSHYEAYSWGKTMGIERWLRKKYDKVTCLTMLIDFGVLHL